LTKGDGTLERMHQFRREALHAGIGNLCEPVGEQLRRGQQVAQVVIDLGNGEAEAGEPALLMQHGGELALHGGELALGDADLVRTRRRHDGAFVVLRIGAECDHVGGDAPHRPHEHIVQRQIDERRGNGGDDKRQEQDVGRIAQHRLAQRLLVHHELDIFAAHRRRTDHAHHVFLVVEHGGESVDDGVDGVDIAHVVSGGDHGRHVIDREHAPARAHLHRHRARTDGVENLLAELVGDDAVRRGVEHERRGVSGGQPVLQPYDAEIGDRRHIDQHFRDHHEENRENEEFSRKAKARRPDLLRPHRGFFVHDLSPLPSQNG